jgi:aspartate-semialdehyde dehydrogenase
MLLTAFGDEPALIEIPSAHRLQDADVVLFAGDPAQTLKYWKDARSAGALVIDLSSALDLQPEAVVIGGGDDEQERAAAARSGVAVVAHPAAQLLARLLSPLQRFGIESAAATVFEPVSERGKPAILELEAQTRNLLAFRPAPTDIYGGQIAFNIVAGLDESVHPSLADIAARIGLHLRRIAAAARSTFSLPALQVLQAPVFHAHTVSLFLRFASDVQPAALEAAIARDDFNIAGAAEGAPDALRAAGEDRFQIGPARRDATVKNGFWFFATLDNLRTASRTAVQAAFAITESRSAPPH